MLCEAISKLCIQQKAFLDLYNRLDTINKSKAEAYLQGLADSSDQSPNDQRPDPK